MAPPTASRTSRWKMESVWRYIYCTLRLSHSTKHNTKHTTNRLSSASCHSLKTNSPRSRTKTFNE